MQTPKRRPQASWQSPSLSPTLSRAPGVDLPSPEPRRRRDAWSRKETIAFIDIWKAEDIQLALGQQYRNMKLFAWIADRLRERGFERDAEQCRSRAKDLKRGYKEIKCGNLHSGRAPKTAPYFKLLEQFLCLRKGIVCGKVCGAGVVERLDKRRKRLPLNPMAATWIAREALLAAPETTEVGGRERRSLASSHRVSLPKEVQKSPPQAVQEIPSDPKQSENGPKHGGAHVVGEENSPQKPPVSLTSQEHPVEPQVEEAVKEPRRLLVRFRRERNWRQRPASARHPTTDSSLSSSSSPPSPKASPDLVETLWQLHQQDLRALDATRREERADDRQERQLERRDREQDRAATRRMMAAIERSHQTLADLMGRQTAAMEAIATAFSGQRPALPVSFPGYDMDPGFDPSWSLPTAAPDSGQRHSLAPEEPGTSVPLVADKDHKDPDAAQPLLSPSADLPAGPDPPLVPSSKGLLGPSATSPRPLDARPKRAVKRKKSG
ncbi:hypothetical protein JRQ81_012173 [Phrynocephalus forsythii]|uniref:Myb/SANT-like DNA-binding domain-containing protein n=1 Tax=Phrynocephalus forsythii TaxID=171643 RepID=A0A9Q1AQ99_9SAUR|nr:hypothetical protein JRQ81_012173 [Phrynocephalus forsythii]